MFIFDLASQHAGWLAARQAAAAQNVANANTPAYKAKDVAPFESVLAQTSLGLAVTDPGHMGFATSSGETLVETTRQAPWDVNHSGNDVALEAELLKISENGRMQALDTGLTRTFHRMILTSLKA